MSTGVSNRAVSRASVLAITSAGAFMAFLDVTIVNVAFQDIRHSLHHAGIPLLSWVLTAYNIVFAAMLVPAGRLADALGRRRLFVLGVSGFAAASALAAASTSAEMLIGARVLQATAGALIGPSSLALLMQAYPPERRATVIGAWGGMAALAAAAGPPLGGALVQLSGWRAIFLVNVPVGIVTVAAARRRLQESRGAEAGLPDMLGVVLVAASVAAVVFAIVQGTEWGWSDPRVFGACAIGLVLGAAVLWRSRSHPRPVIELSLLRRRPNAVANVGACLFSMGFYALQLNNVFFLVLIWRYSILDAGLALMPPAILAGVAAVLAGRASDRFGARPAAVLGTLVFAGGVLMLRTRLDVEPDFVGGWLPGVLLTGVGVGCAFSALASAAIGSLPPAWLALGTGMHGMARQLGAAVGIALLVVVIGHPSALTAEEAFQAGWVFCAAMAVLAGIVSLAIGRTQVAIAEEDQPAVAVESQLSVLTDVG